MNLHSSSIKSTPFITKLIKHFDDIECQMYSLFSLERYNKKQHKVYQTHCSIINRCYFASYLTDVCFHGFHWQLENMDSDKTLVPKRQRIKAVYVHHTASEG